MFYKFLKLSTDLKITYFLKLSEEVISKLIDSPDYRSVRSALDVHWEWLKFGKVEAVDLYQHLENLNDTGLITLMQAEEDEEKLKVWNCIVYALVYSSQQAFGYNEYTTLPQTIESLEPDEIFNEFNKYFDEIIGSEAGKIRDELLDNLLSQNPPRSCKDLNNDYKIASSIVVARMVLDNLSILGHKVIAEKAIDLCERWEKEKDVSADSIYGVLDGEFNTEELLKNMCKTKEELNIWIYITNVINFTSRIAYEYKGTAFFPRALRFSRYELFNKVIDSLSNLNLGEVENLITELEKLNE